ncbi:MupA/Atu3671 family FMN-dependent luciferase-like monooxygenase [Piscinibacter sp. HJYY11]|uniref:MupA/Atu3671 family FMN-dependent luciferase-like monooxygenase n=1 Tax=Piscinibacter sp. HJYY11 TaxID=2801333 RepID=UPI00191D24C6|nr:MupA/Atu3671 family FMN-dependent luciferase-like monooxygenase [Piscinibacter sp. HJYY11]MBL0730309.1 LLM class flavin-dependent oxidoreductase [Piscinibacter sp. HJYY11]
MANSVRSVLIGSESLLIQCGQVLEQAGHQIVAVVTTRAAIRRWAAEKGIRVLADSAALLAAQDIRPFDYLFSITNLSVLSPEVIAMPTRAAINFHDGPLPEYAGLNTPVWAMLNGEGRHGITWHVMTDKVDQGDILVQRRFDLSEGETALTLNTKCFEAGMESFEELVKGLADGTLQGRPQTEGVLKYFGRKDRPEAACAIRWDQPASKIATLVRALDFGTYANPIGAAKALYNGQLLLVPELKLLEDRSGLPAGTIVSVNDAALVVATGDFDVQIPRLETLDGKPRFLNCPVLNLRSGARFEVLDAAAADQLSAINASLASHETFWLRRLETQTSLELPYIDRSAAPVATQWQQLDAALPAGDADARIAALVGYLARLTDKDGFDLGFADPALRRAVGAAPAWFAQQVQLRVALDFSRGFDALRKAVADELTTLRKRVGYASDIVARSPELRTAAAQKDPRVQPVALLIVDQLDDAVALPGSELTIAITADGTQSRWIFDAAKLARGTVSAMQQQAAELLKAAEADASRALAELPLWDAAERSRVLDQWNATDAPARTDACVHRLFEEQAARTPNATAVTCEDQSLTYDELNRRANQLARRLKSLGVGPDVLVGLCAERSVEMMVGLIAIHKAGGAYVPLDPSYPKDRIAYMVEDSKVPVLLTQDRVELPKHSAKVIKLDTDWASIATESAEPFDGGAEPQHLAYVIYTSGSTGKPKGVMVEHRNVVNFFAGMDHHLGEDRAGTWVAVTSLSFDISVLELCWTLTRGFHVVIATGEERSGAAPRGAAAARPLDFSLFYFSANEAEGEGQEKHDKYKLLLEGAKYGDQHGFSAVWTPERHFHAFGGLYPNPAVAGAAIAAVTERIKIRAGSVVLPLHHPLRVAEEWSVVDNISKGRVGISFASGWQPNDFVLKPENFADNKNIMLRNIETVRKLWRGEKCSFPGATGNEVEVGILPRPVQKDLPFWVTSAGNPETFIAAGKLGANVLTHLLGQTVEELDGKLAAYRKAWKDAGHPGEGYVTLMLHTFVGPDEAEVRAKVKQPLIDYLKTSLNLVKQYAWSFPAFKKREGMDGPNSTASLDLQSLSDEEMQGLMEHSFNRYYETSGLFGTPESCLKQVDAIKAIGVDEVACLIDFGVDSPSVLAHLEYLNELRKNATPRRAAATVNTDYSIPTLLKRHQATHLQCTPSMARMLLLDPAAADGLRGLKRMMVGGEALQAPLARELKGAIASNGHLMNMYGPTETTIWSSVHRVDTVDGIVPLGKPLANQAIYILDTRQQPTPVGVPGELVIGGKGVVRGYLHRPELTAERFLPHPLKGAAGGRVYRTGDLARLRDDGSIEFLGRFDHQVKVRGYRIELGEIEASLLSHTGVRETVVVAREDTPGDVRLVAYIVPSAKDSAPAAELKEHLRARMPDFMVPAHFVTLDALPQTPNGKIDRKQLPAPEASKAPVATEAFVAPASDLEEQIAAIWKDVLKLPQVGARDNFFDLGGHSLLAVQAHRRLRDTLQRDISITDIFRFPTIQSLSAYLGEGGVDDAGAKAGNARAQGRRAVLQQRRQASRV